MGNCQVYNLKAAIPLTNDAEFFPGQQKSWRLASQINHEEALTGRPAGKMIWAGLVNFYCRVDQTNGLKWPGRCLPNTNFSICRLIILAFVI